MRLAGGLCDICSKTSVFSTGICPKPLRRWVLRGKDLHLRISITMTSPLTSRVDLKFDLLTCWRLLNVIIEYLLSRAVYLH